MKFKNCYKKHQDKIELGRAYLGVCYLFILMCFKLKTKGGL